MRLIGIKYSEHPVFRYGAQSCEMSVLCDCWAYSGPLVHSEACRPLLEVVRRSSTWNVCLKVRVVGGGGWRGILAKRLTIRQR